MYRRRALFLFHFSFLKNLLAWRQNLNHRGVGCATTLLLHCDNSRMICKSESINISRNSRNSRQSLGVAMYFFSTKKNKSLWGWCCRTRSSYQAIKEGRTPHIVLCPERIQRLESMGFDFHSSLSIIARRSDLMFNQRLREVKEFKAEFGHCINHLEIGASTRGALTRQSNKREESHI